MCELFCLSSRHPMRTTLSLRHFAAHGAPDGRNVDGWGVVFHEGRDIRLYKEPEPAGVSPWVDFIENYGPPTRMLISHIRRATVGGNSHANTQPFARELGGRMHLFAHNGGLGGIDALFGRSPHRFQPVGETDSERGFCILLERLAGLWAGHASPSLEARRDVVAAFAAEMRPLGIANFLYSDGDYVFAHGHKRTQADGKVAPPGLWLRHHRHTTRAQARQITSTARGLTIHADTATADETQEMALLASVPVMHGDWSPLAEGEVVVVAAGKPVQLGPH
ncbi:MAG: class II glutamine amidotransferase [Reyranella sp.]|uniref:class II glutamine amidotransferase n=1 Tax=Reyranella sp. TaxID=1929291 RepID=UPI003D0FB94A